MKKTKSPILAAVHDTAKGLNKASVMDQVTLREFDQLCLPPVETLRPEQIKDNCESTRAMKQLRHVKLGNLRTEIQNGLASGSGRPAKEVFADLRRKVKQSSTVTGIE